jgi:hypothetical protein
MTNRRQVVTADVQDGSIHWRSGCMRGARKMFYVDGRANIYVKGRVDDRMYERLTLDLMRRMASIGLPVSELKRVSRCGGGS